MTGPYSIDAFNAKVKVAVLQQRQNWEVPQIKDLKQLIPEHYTFMVCDTFFIALGIPNKHLENATRNKSNLPSDTYEKSLDR